MRLIRETDSPSNAAMALCAQPPQNVPARINDCVILVRHQAEREAVGFETLQALTEDLEPATPVLIVVKNGLAPVSACRHVMQRAGKLQPRWTGAWEEIRAHGQKARPDAVPP